MAHMHHLRAVDSLSALVSIEELDLSYTLVTDLSPLTSLSALRELNLEGLEEVDDITPLSCMVQLETLNICYTAVQDVALLQSCVALQTLHAGGDDDIFNVETLSRLHQLELVGRGTGTHGVSQVSKLVNLQKLYLSGAGVMDMNGMASLAVLTNLDTLMFRDCHLGDMASLSKLVQLRHLACTCLHKLACLPFMPKLLTLDIHISSETDLSPVCVFTELQTLHLSKMVNLVDVTPLSTLVQLRRLDLTTTKVMNLTPLSNLTKLTSLDLNAATHLEDLSPLSTLVQMEVLNLCDIPLIVDVSTLSLLTRLQKLNLSHNHVHHAPSAGEWTTPLLDVSPLSSMSSLRYLDLRRHGTLSNAHSLECLTKTRVLLK